jgi:hypothetical protein
MIELRGLVAIPPRSIKRVEWRVSWSRSDWRRQPKTRLFAREHDAFRHASRRQLEGYEVRLQWREVGEWQRSHTEFLEHHLGNATASRLHDEALRAHARRTEKTLRRAALTVVPSAEPVHEPFVDAASVVPGPRRCPNCHFDNPPHAERCHVCDWRVSDVV